MTTATDLPSPLRFDLALFPALLALGFIAALIEVARSPDPAMVVQAWTFMACMGGIGIFY
ncbi:MAG: hypothetical protein ISQ86_08085, partial [Alphaproteobacteria bacterium]|nr:hypothetical protein [Alphaproteobacteria bacterium]